MSVTDHYPRKKRRPCLSTKASKRNGTTKKEVTVTYTQNNTPPLLSKDIPLPLKNQRKLSPSGHPVSSDESCLEIGWDNNSPSPTKVLQAGKSRKRSKHKAPDITKLLKIIPKKKKSSDVTETSGNDMLLSTWMQENLAVSTTTNASAPSSTSNRRSVMKRSLRNQGVLDFNEQLKKFVETSSIPEHCHDKTVTGRKSPRLLEKKEKENFPPKLINYSPSDSLLLMENFDELLIGEKEGNQCNEVLTHVKTPKIKRTKTLVDARVDSALKLSSMAGETTSITTADNKEKPTKDDKNTSKTDAQTDELIDLTLDGDDSIGNFLLHESFTKVKCNESNDQRVKSLTAKRKYMSTPKLVKAETGLVGFDDDLLLDEMLMDLDEEFKCKSQETPPRLLSENQRKLKTRSHTSPFPLNKRCKRTVTSTGLTRQDDVSIIQNANELKMAGVGFVPIRTGTSCSKLAEKTQPKTNKSSFVSKSIASERCKRPFVPPRKGEHTMTFMQDESHRQTSVPFPMDLSLIKVENKDQSITNTGELSFLPNRSANYRKVLPPISSTQKCNFEEIERKRREAQLRLRQRSRRK